MADKATKIVSTTGTGVSDWVHLPRRDSRDEILLQFDFSSTGSVTIECSFDETNLSPVTIVPAQTANAIVPIASVPRIRANVASNAGTIKIYANIA